MGVVGVVDDLGDLARGQTVVWAQLNQLTDR